jgi:hypothetical protein|tara:strand:+ start:658 stop:1065 length:408 start_codon:yes stop_codon:yes gene_type:complete
MGKEKSHNSGNWTVARFNSFIKGGLRQMSHRWPPKHEVKKAARRERGVYLCAGYKCRKHKVPVTIIDKKNTKYRPTGQRINNIFVDHIVPVIDPEKGFVSWDAIVERMFCEADGLQVLCRKCHSLKTKDERAMKK